MKHFRLLGTWSSLLALLMSMIVITDCLAVDPEGNTPEIKQDREKIRQYLAVVHSLKEIEFSFKVFSNLPSTASDAQREDALNGVRLAVKDVSAKQDMFVVYAAGTVFPEKVDAMVKPLVSVLSSKAFINQRAKFLANISDADIIQLKSAYELFLKLPMPSEEDILYCEHYGLTSLNSR